MGNEKLLIPVENTAIRDKVKARVLKVNTATFLEEKIEEFDDCSYLLQCFQANNDIMMLSMALPRIAQKELFLTEVTFSIIKVSFEGLAEVVEPVNGYDITLQIDVRAISQLPPEEQNDWISSIASLRLLILGMPLRLHMLNLQDGMGQESPTQAIFTDTGKGYFVKPQADSVVVVFPLHFSSPQDNAIARTFLQEFADTSRDPAFECAPSCSYSPSRSPPMCVRDQTDELLGRASSGFMTFTVRAQHVSGPHMELVLWRIISFPILIQYHVQACKGWMHLRMRARLKDMQADLDPSNWPKSAGAQNVLELKSHSQGRSSPVSDIGSVRPSVIDDPAPPAPDPLLNEPTRSAGPSAMHASTLASMPGPMSMLARWQQQDSISYVPASSPRIAKAVQSDYTSARNPSQPGLAMGAQTNQGRNQPAASNNTSDSTRAAPPSTNPLHSTPAAANPLHSSPIQTNPLYSAPAQSAPFHCNHHSSPQTSTPPQADILVVNHPEPAARVPMLPLPIRPTYDAVNIRQETRPNRNKYEEAFGVCPAQPHSEAPAGLYHYQSQLRPINTGRAMEERDAYPSTTDRTPVKDQDQDLMQWRPGVTPGLTSGAAPMKRSPAPSTPPRLASHSRTPSYESIPSNGGDPRRQRLLSPESSHGGAPSYHHDHARGHSSYATSEHYKPPSQHSSQGYALSPRAPSMYAYEGARMDPYRQPDTLTPRKAGYGMPGTGGVSPRQPVPGSGWPMPQHAQRPGQLPNSYGPPQKSPRGYGAWGR